MKWSLLVVSLFAQSLMLAQPRVVLKEDNVENAYPRLSKDGTHILYQSNRTGKWQLYICDLSGKQIKQVTNDTFNENLPDWSPDNQWIAFVSDRDGNEEIYLAKADGSGVKRVTENPARDIHPYFSPDGTYLLFNSDRAGGQFDVFRYDIVNHTTERITNTPDNETCARYAPDMKQIVLLKNNDVTDDIWLMNIADGKMINLSNTPYFNHGWPVFSHDGRWVYYSSMEDGTYSIYRIKADRSGKQRITHASKAEENARVNLSPDDRFMIYNVRSAHALYVVLQTLER